MPFIHIRLADVAPSPAQRDDLSRETVRLMATILRKQAALTSVLIEPVPVASRLWTVGGEPAAVAAHLEATITAGTNTTAEKADFIAAAAAMLRRVCGPDLPAATYVVIREIDGDDWGYDGRTQSSRRSSTGERSA